MKKVLTVLEFQTIPFEQIKIDKEGYDEKKQILRIRKDTLTYLEELNERYKPKIIKIYRNRLHFQNYVGVIKAGDLSIEILPKILAKKKIKSSNRLYIDESFEQMKQIITKNLLYMLKWAPSINFLGIDVADLEYTEGFFETIVVIFAKKLLKLLKVKRNMLYLEKYNKLNYMREKIDIKNYGINLAQLNKIPCFYHERSLNTVINKTLKFSIYLMLKLIKNSETFQLLKKIDNFLFSVDFSRISPEEIDKVRYNRLNIEFKPFIQFCKFLIQHCTIKMQTSRLEFFSLLIPMEILFEKFIANYLKIKFERLLPDCLKTKPKSQEKIGYLISTSSNKLFKLKPDISINNENRVRVIIDTKYKILSKSGKKKDNYGVSQSDIYQMYAYCKEYNATKCLLLYPEAFTGKFDNINWKMGSTDDIDLYIRTISLTYDFMTPTGKKSFESELHEALSCLG